MTKLPTEQCPFCGRVVPVRRTGLLRQHKARAAALRQCKGSGQPVWTADRFGRETK